MTTLSTSTRRLLRSTITSPKPTPITSNHSSPHQFNFTNTWHYRTYSKRPQAQVHASTMKPKLPDIYALKNIIDPRLPGINDKAVAHILSPLTMMFRRCWELLVLRRKVGFFEQEGKVKVLKKTLQDAYRDLYECRHISHARALCTPAGYEKLRHNVPEMLKAKRDFPQNGEYKLLNIVHVVRLFIPNVDLTFVQVTARVQLPNNDVDYVVFERDMSDQALSTAHSGVAWKFAGWVDPAKVYKKPTMTDLVGVGA